MKQERCPNTSFRDALSLGVMETHCPLFLRAARWRKLVFNTSMIQLWFLELIYSSVTSVAASGRTFRSASSAAQTNIKTNVETNMETNMETNI